MKEILVFIQFIVIAISQTNDSIDCNKYFSKLETQESQTIFSGEVDYFEISKEVQINLKYTDVLFEDPLYFGLVQEDGKTSETTCLKLNILECYIDNKCKYHEYISDLSIIPSNTSSNQQRQYSFKIPISQLEYDFKTNNIIQNGSYLIIFESTNQVAFKYEFIFDISITINNDTKKLMDTAFKQQILDKQSYFNIPQSKLFWCTDITCSFYLNESPYLKLNDNFFIKQVILNSEKNNQYLVNTKVVYLLSGSIKKATPIQIINTTPGQVILELKAEINWRWVFVNVNSALSDNPENDFLENIIKTSFYPLTTTATIQLLHWCADIKCEKILKEIPNLHFNDLFVLQISFLSFTHIDVFFIGKGLNKTVTPVQVINKSGIIQLKAEVVWEGMKIQVVPKSKQVNDSGIQTILETDEISCIKPEASEDCATCLQECQINGFAREECGVCDKYGFLAFVHMIILLCLLII